jgi:hypothetical protein
MLWSATVAWAVPPLRATAFGKVEIEQAKVSGSLWLERDVMEAKQPIDADGDMQYSPGELLAARSMVTDYINTHFFIMWEGKIHPIVARDMVTEKRPGLKYNYLKIAWVSQDSPNSAPISIMSRLLSDVWRDARTMLFVSSGRHREVWILSPADYFESSLLGKPAELGSGRTPHKPMPRRFACVDLCLGVEIKDGVSKCPRCGQFIAEAKGAEVPGAGFFGLHGGPLMTVGTKKRFLEAALASREELRFYLTDDALTKLPMDKAGGSVEVWTDELMESTLVKFPLTPGTAGAYLSAKIPPKLDLPLRARCSVDLGDGATYMIDFPAGSRRGDGLARRGQATLGVRARSWCSLRYSRRPHWPDCPCSPQFLRH